MAARFIAPARSRAHCVRSVRGRAIHRARRPDRSCPHVTLQIASGSLPIVSDTPPDAPDPDHDADLIPMRVGGVVIDPNTQVPVVILRGFEEPRLYVPIYIGGLEATAIATVLAGVEMPRPMTHDLIMRVLDTVGCRITAVCVTRLDGGTFFAEVHVADETDAETVLDARPSDALALALRAGAPISVARAVIEEAGALAPEGDAEDHTDDDGPETDDGLGDIPAGDSIDDPDDQPDMPPEPGTVDAEGPKKREPADGPRSFFGDVKLEDLVPEDFGKYKM